MATPFVGEIKMFGGNFAIFGWSFCNGSLIPISQNPALFNLIGTTYGGDGVNNFALPDLQCRVPVHQGQGPGLSNYVIGTKAGFENVTLNGSQLPTHRHQAVGSSASGGANSPAGNTWAKNITDSFGPGTSANASMNTGSTSNTGSNQPHDNIIPFLAITFIIALNGLYPSQT